MGYSKYDYKNKDTDNSRNGYSQKTVQDNLGKIEINVLRDRKGEYASQLVKIRPMFQALRTRSYSFIRLRFER